MVRAPKPAYPPPPWRLRGRAFAAAWLVRDLEAPIPSGWAPLKLGPFHLLGAVWAGYGLGGDLSYRELALGLVVRKGAALAVTLPWVWVDSQASQAGGRALWAIPKDMAAFRQDATAMTAETPLGPAGLQPRRRGAHMGRRTLGFATAQPDQGRTIMARASITADIRWARADWRLPIALPAKPLMSFELEDLQLVFGD